jgi:flagellar biosynthesis protein FlhF
MIVKKFQAPTETEAVLKARDELGSSAVVLNVKTLKQRGIFRLFRKDMVEITAAQEENEGAGEKSRTSFDEIAGDVLADTDMPAQEGPAAAYTPSGYAPRVSMPVRSPHPAGAYQPSSQVSAADTAAIEQKLDSLQQLLKNRMDYDYTVSKERTADRAAQDVQNSYELNGADEGRRVVQERENTNYRFLQLIYKKMLENDVNEKCADSIIGDIENSLKKESNIDSILAAVYQKVILKLGEPHIITLQEDKPKVAFFIGPTGVGKTTTIAKIASKFKLEEHARVAFITSDTYRIAAVEQLNTYASIISCPVSVVYSADELEHCLEEYKDYDLILVDTAGRSHKAEGQMDELMELIERTRQKSDEFDVDIYLTLSVTTKSKDLVSIVECYQDIKDWSVIFTKLDETCSLGNILNIRMITDAPLSYTTLGQNVPNDIEVIDKQALAKQLLGGAE